VAAVAADAETQDVAADDDHVEEGLAAIGLAGDDVEDAVEAPDDVIGGDEPEAGAQETAKPSED
jgi:hypothetical protein